MSASREYENRWVRQTDRQEAALQPEDRQDMRVRQAGHAGWEGQDSSACWLGRQELRVWTFSMCAMTLSIVGSWNDVLALSVSESL